MPLPAPVTSAMRLCGSAMRESPGFAKAQSAINRPTSPTHCHSAKPASSSAEARLTQACARASKRERSRPTTALSSSHHSAEPTSTPAIMVHGELTARRAPSVPNTAMKEKIVAGFDSVSTKVPAKHDSSPAPPPACAAFSAGFECQMRQASHSRKAPPPSASGTRAPTSASMIQVTPKAPTAPYSASAAAAPSPVARPTSEPRCSVRWITSRPIGPTGAAIDSPISSDCANSARFRHQPLRCGAPGPAWPARSRRCRSRRRCRPPPATGTNGGGRARARARC